MQAGREEDLAHVAVVRRGREDDNSGSSGFFDCLLQWEVAVVESG